MASVFDDLELPNGATRTYLKSEIRARIQRLVPKALRALESNLYAEDEKVQVQAATALLDRAGYGPQSKVTVEDTRVDITSLSQSELAQRALAVARQIMENSGETPQELEEGPLDSQVH